MKHYIFEKNFPSLNYIKIRWPASKNILAKYIMSNHRKPDLFKLSIICLKELNFRNHKKVRKELKKVSEECSKNVNFNTYHNEHHYKAVLVIACVMGKIYSLNNFDKLLLVFLALAHDMNHQGRRILSKPYYQEKMTLKNLNQIIFRKISNYKKWKRIEKILMNTYFQGETKVKNDILEKIILDSDLLSSLIFGFENGLELAKRLKYELKLEISSLVLFKKFLESLIGKKLYLDYSKI